MARPCDHPTGPTYSDVCRVCWLYENDPAYRDMYDAMPAVMAPARPPCLHLGPVLEYAACNCPEKDLHACECHSTADEDALCTRGPVNPRVRCCQSCPDFQGPPPPPPKAPLPGPFTGPVRRNLLYHVHPVSGNGAWQANVRQLRRRLGLFDGRKVVSVTVGEGLDSPCAVRDALGADVEWLVVPNDPGLGEVVAFPGMLERVRSLDVNEVTFYGHAKGVTHDGGASVHAWAATMYEVCLDYWPLVEEQLGRFAFTGAFRKLGGGFDRSRSTWHYTGTFFWLRHAAVFARDWEEIDRHPWGVESWPSLQFTKEEAGCLFLEDLVSLMNLYRVEYLRGVVAPALKTWREKNANRRQPCTATS